MSTDHTRYFPVRCPKCGWTGMSNETAGGNAIADTGDYSDIVCPVCLDKGDGQWVPVEDIEEKR